jgi:hypothetical protein
MLADYLDNILSEYNKAAQRAPGGSRRKEVGEPNTLRTSKQRHVNDTTRETHTTLDQHTDTTGLYDTTTSPPAVGALESDQIDYSWTYADEDGWLAMFSDAGLNVEGGVFMPN